MYYYAVCIFLSAFLLFQVEPMIGKYILPWFGGSPAVWSSVMLFFQVLLTGGYAYAAWIASPARRREKVHVILLGFSLALMLALSFFWKTPITPGAAFKPQPGAFPVGEIFKLLFVSVGLPFFLLSANSPLIQAWFDRFFPEKTAYKLYALSNVGSLIALISYPILIEPYLPLTWQARIWSLGYAVFAGLSIYGALKTIRQKSIARAEAVAGSNAELLRPRPMDYFFWISLSATASALLLAVTSQITQEVASIPFLWVLPLVVYLFTFILAFSSERWYSRQVFLLLSFGATILTIWTIVNSARLGIWYQIGGYSLILFIACMVCHGELYRLRPHPSRLTTFYLMVSLGGAIGGLVINLVVPYVFKGYWELFLGLTLCWALFFVVTILYSYKARRLVFLLNLLLLVTMVTAMGFLSYQQIHQELNAGLAIERSFFGVIRIREERFHAEVPIHVESIDQDISGYDRFILIHGKTIHGFQFQDPSLHDLPTAYFGRNSGVGIALLNYPNRGKGMRVGILGLGIGTLAAYGQPGDVYRFYEINPQVISLAEGQGGYFSYLPDSRAKIEVVEGDARLSLENELADGHPQNYDVLVLDVFSSDSIPVHLIDEEAFALYLQHLKPEGILAAHISNMHLDLQPVVRTLATHFGLASVLIKGSSDGVTTKQSLWVLLARDPALLDNPNIAAAAEPLESDNPNIRLWTDDYNNLFQILH